MGKGKKSIKRLSMKQMAEKLAELFSSQPDKVLSFKDIFRALKFVTHPQKMQAIEVMEEMAWDDYLTQVSDNSYKLNTKGQVQEGTFVRKSNGKNSFIPADGGTPIFVAERNSMGALNGDKVKVSFMARRTNHIKEAQVIEVMERAKDTFVGRLKVDSDIAYLVPQNDIFAHNIIIPKKKIKGGKTDDKAVVKIVQWPDGERKNPVGEVVDILGQSGDNDVEMNTILAQYGLPYKYPKAVEEAADKITGEITAEDYAEREDFRNVFTCTIDPRDAKDFDDALSIRKLDGGLWEVGVHIADVTHYVHPGTIIDKEAEKRATSVYLVDRTIPMLPEHLCNGICSLRPNEEKLAYSCIFEMDDEANILDHRIRKTVILSDRRFTYEEAQQIIETKEGDFKEEVLALDSLAKKLRKRRFDNGSVAFDRVEVRFEIDDKGHPIKVFFKESKDANKLVEEFMLLANKQVATAIGKPGDKKKAKPFVYRIHDNPDPDKLSNFAEIASRFGYKLKTVGKRSAVNNSLNKMLTSVKGQPEENLLSILAIRSMAKAVYSTVNVGHYGLAFDYYTHFTSPIRRYPDMMVHRLLDKYLSGGRAVNKDKLEAECKHSSDMEQLAANAERASIKYKQVEFMADHLGEEYQGSVSGVTEWGLYVEIDENKCEGMVPIRDLDDDYYEFDEKNYCLIGRRKKHIYQLGDKLTVKVARTDLNRKILDFALAGDSIIKHEDKPLLTKNGDLVPVNSKKSKKSKKGSSKRSTKKSSKKNK